MHPSQGPQPGGRSLQWALQPRTDINSTQRAVPPCGRPDAADICRRGHAQIPHSPHRCCTTDPDSLEDADAAGLCLPILVQLSLSKHGRGNTNMDSLHPSG
jgi:hypothetical protein